VSINIGERPSSLPSPLFFYTLLTLFHFCIRPSSSHSIPSFALASAYLTVNFFFRLLHLSATLVSLLNWSYLLSLARLSRLLAAIPLCFLTSEGFALSIASLCSTYFKSQSISHLPPCIKYSLSIMGHSSDWFSVNLAKPYVVIPSCTSCSEASPTSSPSDSDPDRGRVKGTVVLHLTKQTKIKSLSVVFSGLARTAFYFDASRIQGSKECSSSGKAKDLFLFVIDCILLLLQVGTD